MNRWACLHDLNNYFKKKDLLGGLTEPEKQKVRQNIGVLDAVGDGGKAKPVEINSKSLQELIKGNGLIPGVRYRILDFQTIYNSDTEVWGKDTNPSVVWHLIVIANTNNTLDSRVFIEEHLDWIVEYDITPVKMSDGSFNKGTITYLKDSNGNQAYYDFKNIKFKRDSGNYYTFSDIIGD